MQWRPNVTVAAIVERNKKYLLVEESADGTVVYNQPAGHLERNENLIDAIKREVLEETAWEFEPEGLVGVYLYPNPRIDIVYLRFCFYGNCNLLHTEQKLDEGIIKTVWMSRDEILSAADKLRSEMVLNCIDDYRSGKKYPLELLNHFS